MVSLVPFCSVYSTKVMLLKHKEFALVRLVPLSALHLDSCAYVGALVKMKWGKDHL